MMARGRVRDAIALTLILALSGCSRNSVAPPPTMVEAILARVGQAGTFVDASTRERAAIRHIPSGLVCTLTNDGAFDLEAFPSNAGNPGASCSHASGNVATTLVAVRFGPEANLDSVFRDSVALSAGGQTAQPWPGAPSAADLSSPEGLPHFRIARLQTSVANEPRYLRVAVSEARGWYLQQIVSAPVDEATDAEAQAGLEWRELLRDFVGKP